MERRHLLALLTTSALSSVAGCMEDDHPNGSAEDPQIVALEQDDGADDVREGAGLVTVEGDATVSQTVERIERAIDAGPLTHITTIDHAANAEAVDRELPPTTLVLFGNPDVGTPLITASRTAAIDLPQRMLVWEDRTSGTIRVT